METKASASNSLPILKAVQSGKSIVVFNFSLIDRSLTDVHAILPTVKEASTLQQLVQRNGDWAFDVEEAIIEEYIPLSYERNWLNYSAPAGLATSVATQLLRLANPESLDQINEILHQSRSLVNLEDNLHAILGGACGVSLDMLRGMDVYQLLKTVAQYEPMLLSRGFIEEPFLFSPSEKKETRINQIPNQVREADDSLPQIKMREPSYKKVPLKSKSKLKSLSPGSLGGIDLEEENRRFAEHGLINRREVKYNDTAGAISS